MNGWDPCTNMKPKLQLPKGICEVCGEETHCISSEGLEDYEEYRGQEVCHHCYDMISGEAECARRPNECRYCKHYQESYSRYDDEEDDYV